MTVRQDQVHSEMSADLTDELEENCLDSNPNIGRSSKTVAESICLDELPIEQPIESAPPEAPAVTVETARTAPARNQRRSRIGASATNRRA